MKKIDPKKIIGFLIIALLAINGNLYSQSSSFGNTYIFNNGEMAIVDIQHNFLNGGSGIQPGIVGTDRSVTQGFMSFVGTASWTGASNTAFVDGYVKTYMTTAFTFPIGDNGKYRPAGIATATLANPANAAYYGVSGTTAITSRLRGGNEPVLPASGPFDTSLKGAGVGAVDNVEYWDINGATSAKITLTWDATSAVTSLSSLTIVGWNGTQWVSISSTVDATSLLGGSSTLTTGSITTNVALVPDTYDVYTLGTACNAGTVAPTLSATSKANICPAITVDLSTITASNTPSLGGVTLTWHSGTPATTANKLSSVTALAAGMYYAAFYDATNDCYSSVTTSLTATVSPCVGGTIDCAKTQIYPAPVFGVASQQGLIVTVNVTGAGCFTPLTISGSGMSIANGITEVCTNITGIQIFHIPVKYDGTTILGTMNFTIGTTGSCTADLTLNPKKEICDIWTLDCVPTLGPALK
jgi:hypothetical protein